MSSGCSPPWARRSPSVPARPLRPAEVAETTAIARPNPATRADRMLGLPVLERIGSALTRGRLRILAYHGVPDPVAFRRHVEHLVQHYRIVSGAQVAAWVCDGEALPDRAVWLTFDDGRPTVVEHALP